MTFNYITCAAGDKFITQKAQYAVKSLLRAGISPDVINVAVNTKEERSLFRKLVPQIKQFHVLKVDVTKYKWGYMGGKRRYAPLKPIGITRVFPGGDPNPIVMFDGDVLWYKDPTEFLESKAHMTWFHHGKDLAKRAKIKRQDVDMRDIKSVSQWCRYAFAYLLVKYGVTKIPEREICSGFYILHPNDTKTLPEWDVKGCNILANNKVMKKHDSAGEQCPLNAAMCALDVKWHGGSRFFCPEHVDYFDHFFGDITWKKRFNNRVKKMKLDTN